MNRLKYPPTKLIKAIGLADAYYQLVSTCSKEGALKKRFYGKPVNTYDMVSLTEINHPMLEPMLHSQFPTKLLHLAEYEKQWERNYDWKKQGFEYNYMDRLVNYPNYFDVPEPDSFKEYYNHSMPPYCDERFIDQLMVIRDNIKRRIEKGGECLVSNRDQVITWIPDRDMFVPEDQPCLQRIQFFVYEYPLYEKDNTLYKKGKAEFHCEWRSRDGFAAWNSNMIGLIKMLMKEIFEPNDLELIRVVDFCNSFHLYESDWESAALVKPANISPQFMR